MSADCHGIQIDGHFGAIVEDEPGGIAGADIHNGATEQPFPMAVVPRDAHGIGPTVGVQGPFHPVAEVFKR